MIFPAKQYIDYKKRIAVPSPNSPLSGDRIPDFFHTLCKQQFSRFAASDAPEIPLIFSLVSSSPDFSDREAYHLKISEDAIQITALSESGLFYGMQQLFRLIEQRNLPLAEIIAEPSTATRGIKVYLPEPVENFIEEWKRMIDTLARYHMNTVMIELGGALEYESHPEINEGWLEYAAFMNEYPGKASQIQKKFSWQKNSIHAANGRGKVVSKVLMKELIQYCRERYIEIIPEMPTLSHCDYLLTRHPELSERQNDPYPDTCCPSNPAYYQLIFDLFDEVIELFQPTRINIGHDEFYTMRLCDKCKQRTAPEIYASDIKKIRDHLAEKGVQTMIWGEKLLNSHFLDGTPIGGAERTQPNGDIIDPTYTAINHIPADVEILHWYWGIDREFENRYIEHALKFTFGNFAPPLIPEWKKRASNPFCHGYIISNWGDADFRTLQRNGIWYFLAYACMLSWNPHVSSESHRMINDFVIHDLYSMRQSSLYTPGASRIVLKHTTDINIPYHHFVDGFFVDENRYLLGHHIFTDPTGKEYRFPVIFGSNISHKKVSPARHDDPAYLMDSYQMDMHYYEVTAETLPVIDADETTWYECTFAHPDPGTPLTYDRFVPLNAYAGTVKVKDITFVE